MTNFEQNLNTILEEYPKINYQLDYLGLLDHSDNLRTDLTILEKQIIKRFIRKRRSKVF